MQFLTMSEIKGWMTLFTKIRALLPHTEEYFKWYKGAARLLIGHPTSKNKEKPRAISSHV